MAFPSPTDRRDAIVVVWRSTLEGRDYLALHRRDDTDGEWTVPTASCEADERLHAAATRALWEQTGLVLALSPVDAPGDAAVFGARADADAVAVLDDQHDDHAWLPAQEAAGRCTMRGVASAINLVELRLTEG